MHCPACDNPLPPDAAFCPRCATAQPGVPECNQYDYAAFISYRHREPDAAIATRLHRAIETYRLPTGVAQPRGSRTLGRVFRDQDELPAVGSLPTAIREALKHSRALVVVCSTATPQSRWVQQEIELFASFHGPDRIYAVLAEGASAESLPDSLKTRIRIGADGKIEPVPAEPLAADLREAGRRQFDREKLRIIAALAGCRYDDLAQRARSRRRKRMAAAILGTCALTLAVGVAASQAMQQRQAALVEESQRLAVESQRLLSQGDRYEAIEAALSGLPASSNDASRPLVPETQEALEQALGLDPDDTSPWRSSYSLATDNPLGFIDSTSLLTREDAPVGASTIATCDDAGYFAVSDDAGIISTHDLATGARLATCRMPGADDPAFDNVYTHVLQAAGGRLVVSNPSSNALACFEAQTGECLWSHDSIPIATMAASPDASCLNVAAFSDDGTFSAGMLDMETGGLASATEPEDAALPQLGQGVSSAMGPHATDFCFAVGNKLVAADLATGECLSATLAHPEASSVAWYGETIIACTVSAYDGSELELDYVIEAFDTQLNPLWSREGKVTAEAIESNGNSTLVQGWPVLQGCVFEEGTAAIVSCGHEAQALDLGSGGTVYEHGFAGTVLTAFPWEAGEGQFRLFIACSDGSIVLENPESPTRNYDGEPFRLQLGEPIRWSQIVPSEDAFHWVSVSAAADNRIVVYRTQLGEDEMTEQPHSYDELIAHAEEVLEIAGR